MTLVPATVRCWWDARVRPSPVWARLRAEAEIEAKNADLRVDWLFPHEAYAIACEIAAIADYLEHRADLAIEKDAT
jgi:hypothetical protein